MNILTVSTPITIADEGTSASAEIAANGYLRGVAVEAGAMDGSSTYTVAVVDKLGVTVFSRASLAESSTTAIFADKFGGTAEYSPLAIPLAGPATVTITASEAQNDAAVEYTVHLYFSN